MTWRMKLGQELGYNVTPQIGSYVKPDDWNHGECLISGDDWDQCQFRIHTIGGDMAVNVTVTGYTLQQPLGRWNAEYVRVKIQFVADICQDIYTGKMVGQHTYTRGWMKVTNNEKEYIV